MPNSHKLIYSIYVLMWIIMAINPKYPQDWLLENVLVFFGLLVFRILFEMITPGISSVKTALLFIKTIRSC